MIRQLARIGILGAISVGLVGCGGGGPKLGKVKGKVTYNGQPVAGATVTFKPSQGPLGIGTTDASGEFTLTTAGEPGAVLGDHKVFITKHAAREGTTTDMTPEDLAKMAREGGGAALALPESEIPTKYANPATSGLTATVTADASKNVFDFALTD